MESADARKLQLTDWLFHHCQLTFDELFPMTGDASFRRYFRVATPEISYVAMDAPPPKENCAPFVAIAEALKNMGLQTPTVVRADLEQGFLLLTDFGNLTYLKALNAKNADHLYDLALDSLAVLQSCRHVSDREIPPFSSDFIWQEWAWHKEWFLQKFLKFDVIRNENELDVCYAKLVENAEKQPHTFMHRDYHSANLMVLPNDQVGVLDFQDAFIGPITYDLASLLRDCYIDWPLADVERWALSYLHKLQKQQLLTHVHEPQFLRWFDLMGMQRHLKTLMTFARKYVRDQQPDYLQHIPRTLNYLLHVSEKYPEFFALHDYLLTDISVALKREQLLCAP